MPTYAWVVIGMLTAGIGGALATWGSMLLGDRGLVPQSPEVYRNLTALGGVLAALCGGIASIGRKQTASRKEVLGGLAVIGLGPVVIALIIPEFLFAPFHFFLFAPLQGLSALLGGFSALAALWTVLSLAGIRNESDVAMPFRDAMPTPLGKIGVIAVALSFVLPVLPYLQKSIGVFVLSRLIFVGGLVLCGASLLQPYVVRRRANGNHEVKPPDAID